MRADNVERLATDRPGRAEDGYACHLGGHILSIEKRALPNTTETCEARTRSRYSSFVSTLYVFLDEAGDTTFAPGSSRLFTLTAVSTLDPRSLAYELHCLKHDLIEEVPDREFAFFHAFNDPAPVRRRVFGLLGRHDHYRVDSVSFPKNVIHPPLRPVENFYPHVAHHLLRWVLRAYEKEPWERLIVVVASFKLPRNREAFLKAVKTNVAPYLRRDQRYDVWMQPSPSHPLLQVADYFGWAIHRARERGDYQYRKLVQERIASDFLYYSRVTKAYY
jgi:hypothetical protein